MAYEFKTSQIVNPYEAKAAELNLEIRGIARELQSKTEERDVMSREVNSLKEEKTTLVQDIKKCEKRKCEEIESLADVIDSQKKSVSSYSKEVKSGKESIASAEGKIIALKLGIGKLESASRDFENMASQVGKVREKYLSSKDRLDKTEAKSTVVVEKTDKKLKELANQEKYIKEFNKQMDDAHKKLKKFSAVVKENVVALNSLAEEKDLNLRFGLPPDEIVEIPYETK